MSLAPLEHWASLVGNAPRDMDRLVHTRRMLRSAILAHAELDGHHKSYEGSMELEIDFPCAFDDDPAEATLHVHCYLMYTGRHKTYKGTMSKVVRDLWVDVRGFYKEVVEMAEEAA